MTIEKLIQSLHDNLDSIPAGSLKPETVFREVEGWDSIASLSFLSVIDSEFGIQLSGARFRECKTIAEVYTVISTEAGK